MPEEPINPTPPNPQNSGRLSSNDLNQMIGKIERIIKTEVLASQEQLLSTLQSHTNREGVSVRNSFADSITNRFTRSREVMLQNEAMNNYFENYSRDVDKNKLSVDKIKFMQLGWNKLFFQSSLITKLVKNKEIEKGILKTFGNPNWMTGIQKSTTVLNRMDSIFSEKFKHDFAEMLDPTYLASTPMIEHFKNIGMGFENLFIGFGKLLSHEAVAALPKGIITLFARSARQEKLNEIEREKNKELTRKYGELLESLRTEQYDNMEKINYEEEQLNIRKQKIAEAQELTLQKMQILGDKIKNDLDPEIDSIRKLGEPSTLDPMLRDKLESLESAKLQEREKIVRLEQNFEKTINQIEEIDVEIANLPNHLEEIKKQTAEKFTKAKIAVEAALNKEADKRKSEVFNILFPGLSQIIWNSTTEIIKKNIGMIGLKLQAHFEYFKYIREMFGDEKKKGLFFAISYAFVKETVDLAMLATNKLIKIGFEKISNGLEWIKNKLGWKGWVDFLLSPSGVIFGIFLHSWFMKRIWSGGINLKEKVDGIMQYFEKAKNLFSEFGSLISSYDSLSTTFQTLVERQGGFFGWIQNSIGYVKLAFIGIKQNFDLVFGFFEDTWEIFKNLQSNIEFFVSTRLSALGTSIWEAIKLKGWNYDKNLSAILEGRALEGKSTGFKSLLPEESAITIAAKKSINKIFEIFEGESFDTYKKRMETLELIEKNYQQKLELKRTADFRSVSENFRNELIEKFSKDIPVVDKEYQKIRTLVYDLFDKSSVEIARQKPNLVGEERNKYLENLIIEKFNNLSTEKITEQAVKQTTEIGQLKKLIMEIKNAPDRNIMNKNTTSNNFIPTEMNIPLVAVSP